MLVITSESNPKNPGRYGNSQLRYAVAYVVITLSVLLFLNIYCTETSQELFYRSKEADMVEKCMMAADDIAQLDVLNTNAIKSAISQLDSENLTRLIVTNPSGAILFDSRDTASIGKYALLPEIMKALSGNKVFSWNYHEGTMLSRAAVPVYSYGTLMGCVYMVEHDPEQGALMLSLQRNILSVTLVLELAVILFSFLFSRRFSRRMKSIRTSMRVILGGDYTHKVDVGGRDELTLLGEEFNDLSQRLHTSEGRRRQFVSDASHELKTPLASIKLLSDSILQNEMDMGTVREFVEDIGNEAERLNRMSGKLLSLTRVEADVDSASEIVMLEPTVDRVIRMLSGIAQKNNITIQKNFVVDSPVLILEDDLYQIIFNLVENAIKYNRSGGSVTVSLDRDAENAVMTVSDTGVGIPPDAIGHLFERFFRVDKARSRKSGGTGLGLAIVKSMVERNGGTIQVSSKLNEGSVFTITFPIFDTEEEEL